MQTMTTADRFNASGFGRWINATAGRVFRLAAGATFITVGLLALPSPWGIASLAWGVVPFSAGVFDICYISAMLRGPLTGRAIREFQATC